MRIQQKHSSAGQLASALPETPAAPKDLHVAGGWPFGLAALKKKPTLARLDVAHASLDAVHTSLWQCGEDIVADIQEAEAAYDVFVVAKYLADPLHGTADNTAELVNEVPPSGDPESAPKAEQPAPHEHAHVDHAPAPADDHARPAADAGLQQAPHPIEAQTSGSIMHTLAEHGAPDGTFELALNLSISSAMLPLSGLAIYAAYKETREVSEQRSALRQRSQQLQSERALLQPAVASGPLAAAAGPQIHALNDAIETLAYHQQRNTRDGHIALTSMASASVISAKATEGLALQGGLAIGAKSTTATGLIGHSAAAAGAASAASISSTFVLAPLASVAAVGLGGAFLHQSRKEKTRIVADVARVERFLQQLEPSELSPDAQRYQHFLSTKLEQRSSFAGSFNAWNKGFVAGGATYTASTLAKTGLSAAVLFGGATVTGPVGTGLIVGAGLLGAATMGVGGHQFLLAHGRQKRYRNYETSDTPGADRALLAVADLLPAAETAAAATQDPALLRSASPARDPDRGKAAETGVKGSAGDGRKQDRTLSASIGAPMATAQAAGADQALTAVADALPAPEAMRAAPQHGFELRSALHACADGQEKARETLLQRCAEDRKQRYRAVPRSTDAHTALAQPAHKPSLRQRAKAALFAGATYGRAVLSGKHRQAGEKAARSYAKHADTLTETALAQWLQTPDSVKPQIAYMQCCLELQKKYLQTKLSARVTLPPLDAGTDPAGEAERERTPAQQAQTRLATQLREAQERDEVQLRSVSLMLEELGMAETEQASPDARQRARAQNRLPGLQQRLVGALTANEIAPQPGAAGFAHFCMKQAREDTTDLRGTLLSIEMQAARIREEAAAGAAAPPARCLSG
ncbi:type III secretion system effector XopK [Xanthomonas translucens]|uniref:type III secretion system effector XopK n=1 Tax=Xanthomonas campestris pv. translucens TaxID=343 RepID=UPI000654FBB2|nr:type III secretion system effector XopK [Xanthomonas translucens]AKK69297.1 type III secretion system effector protein [Xanthomonas translucens pv. undulosa]MCT8272199.1 type III secretion system effector protein XopK [Xanthomonas translucens pv. undulosa]WNJ32684.1 type III secretion system effector XopK [Xanthomonas translucens pv. undulosa]